MSLIHVHSHIETSREREFVKFRKVFIVSFPPFKSNPWKIREKSVKNLWKIPEKSLHRSSDLEASHLFLRQRRVVVAGDADGDARHRRPQIHKGGTAQAAGGCHLPCPCHVYVICMSCMYNTLYIHIYICVCMCVCCAIYIIILNLFFLYKIYIYIYNY